MYNEKYTYLKYLKCNRKIERQRDGFHQKGKIYQQDVFSWYIPRRLKLLDVIKSQSTCNSQLTSCTVF